MNNEPFLTFGSPLIAQEEIDEVLATMRSGWLGTGPRVAEFEKNFAEYKNIAPELVAAVNSCTAALHVSLIAADIGAGDEVITTPMTFCASVNAIIHAGATPVLADIDPLTWNIDPEKIEEKITSRTKAILPVHYMGRPCEMDKIEALATKHKISIIEDCAHAIETEFNGVKAGTFGRFGCFSFYVTKNLTTAEGGMVVAKNEQDLARIKRLALHGLSKDAWHRFSDKGYSHYYVQECGFKYNMTDLQAAIGLHQLKRLEKNWIRRKQIWDYYQTSFRDFPLRTPQEPSINMRHAYHLYTVLIDQSRCGFSRDDTLKKMTEQRIGVGVHYLSVPEHPYYQSKFGWQPEDFPNAMSVGRQTLSLPLSAKLTDNDVERVVEAVSRCFDLANQK